MAADVNMVALVGRLTRDPELRSAGSSSVCDLGLAVNERFKDGRSGEWSERGNFFDVTVWGAQAENCVRYLEKGRLVAVQGRLRWESWEKDGQKRSKVKVVADRVQFLGGGDGTVRRQPPEDGDVPIEYPEPVSQALPGDDSEIPF